LLTFLPDRKPRRIHWRWNFASTYIYQSKVRERWKYSPQGRREEKNSTNRFGAFTSVIIWLADPKKQLGSNHSLSIFQKS